MPMATVMRPSRAIGLRERRDLVEILQDVVAAVVIDRQQRAVDAGLGIVGQRLGLGRRAEHGDRERLGIAALLLRRLVQALDRLFGVEALPRAREPAVA